MDLRFILIPALAALLSVSPLSAGPADADTLAPLFPFQPTHGAPDNITNVKTWAGADDRPAGTDGFISASGDHFVDGKGQIIRFLGTNIGMTGCFPDHASSDRLAEELARYGINIVRMHYVSHRTPPEGYPVKDSFIEPVQLERFDYLFAKLKERGIYVYFQLNIARKFSGVNGLQNAASLPKYKNGVDNYDYRMIQLQKRFLKEILSHVNPYTGLAYKDDPAIAMMELANENSIVNVWFAPKYKFTELVEPYKSNLKDMWNIWLLAKYGNTNALKAAWQTGRPGDWPKGQRLEDGTIDWPLQRNWAQLPRRAVDYTEFLAHLESVYFSEMYCYAKVSLGVRQPVTGTQLEYGFNLPQAKMNYCDIHGYWCHPSFRKEWNWFDFDIRNDAMVNGQGHPSLSFTNYGYPASTIAKLARARILGRPFTVSEYDHPNLNEFSAEGNLMLAALGAFQNWSGLMQFAWILDTDYDRDYMHPMFDMCSAPQKLVHFPACYAMFVRGDVKKGDDSIVFAYPSSAQSDIAAVASGRRADAHGAHSSVFLNSLPLAVVSGRQVMEFPELFQTENRTVIRTEEDIPRTITDAVENRLVKSSTGEITWDWRDDNAGVFTVDTRNVKVFSGFVKGRSFLYRGMVLTPGKTRLDWLTLSLTLASPKGQTKAGNNLQPGSYLLAATGVVRNTGEKIVYPPDLPGRISCGVSEGGAVGTGPILCEGIPARLTFSGIAGRVKCFALGPDGERLREVPVTTDNDGQATIYIGPEYKTVWYEIIVDEAPVIPATWESRQ